MRTSYETIIGTYITIDERFSKAGQYHSMPVHLVHKTVTKKKQQYGTHKINLSHYVVGGFTCELIFGAGDVNLSGELYSSHLPQPGQDLLSEDISTENTYTGKAPLIMTTLNQG